MLSLRKQFGPGAIAYWVLNKIQKREKMDGPNKIVSEAIAMYDEILSNNDLTIEELKEKAFEIVQKWVTEFCGSSSNSK